MHAQACSKPKRRVAAIALAAALAPCVYAQAPEVQRARPAPSPAAQPAPSRMVIQIYAEKVTVYSEPSPRATVLAELQKGTRVEATTRRNNWFRVTLSDGRSGWIALTESKTSPNFAIDETPGVMLARPVAPTEGAPAADAPATAAAPAGPVPEDRVLQQRPMGRPLEPVIPIIDPKQVPPPSPLLPAESVPIPDRWRLTDQLKLVNMRWYDPYNPNTIKGDRPIAGTEDWFFEFIGISDTLLEWRRIPTPSAAQSTVNPQTNDVFTKGQQFTFEQNLITSFALIKGNTTFKPPELEFRFTPVFNYNYNKVEEVRVLNIVPTKGTTRSDSFVGIQELFIDYEYRIVNDRYDFDDVRVGIQPFISDFRGFLFQDEPVGLRFFGTRESNLYQYNIGWFRRMEKDTNSGLNDIGKPLRDDDVFFANLYRQDFWVPGFTLQGTLIYNRNSETSQFFDNNGFQIRPAVAGTALPRSYDVWYLGANGDGHFGAWNVTASAYWAIGKDDRNAFSGESANINAFFAAAEVSRDFDWIRVRGSALFASGDKDPYDGNEGGFDTILENPQFAGADTSFWIRQGIPLIGGGGVGLKGRNALLPDLRSSKDQGQSNFVNPGLTLIGIGADFDVLPELRVIGNLNQLWFNDTSSLSTLRNQGNIDKNIGTDISVAVSWRPYFTQNIVFNASAAVLVPGTGWKQLFNNGGGTPYSILANLVLTF